MAVGFTPLHANRKTPAPVLPWRTRTRGAGAEARGRRADARTKAIISGPDREGSGPEQYTLTERALELPATTQSLPCRINQHV
ncbi:hypothetical protein [Desulfovibrio sp. UIB00]|uniref:hypothetical protein n=1 Tax=Desulfovibrio sp. UIB00 TaxID=2804314 RepID=UPI001F0E18C5|nr:hypothetical protein [Desulfovibrio sp. UIB00]